MVNIIDFEQELLAAMVRAYRERAGLSNAQLRIRVRDDLYRNAPVGSVEYLSGLDPVAFDRLGGMAFDLRLGEAAAEISPETRAY